MFEYHSHSFSLFFLSFTFHPSIVTHCILDYSLCNRYHRVKAISCVTRYGVTHPKTCLCVLKPIQCCAQQISPMLTPFFPLFLSHSIWNNIAAEKWFLKFMSFKKNFGFLDQRGSVLLKGWKAILYRFLVVHRLWPGTCNFFNGLISAMKFHLCKIPELHCSLCFILIVIGLC